MRPLAMPVHPLSEVRERLSGILARFRQDGGSAEPVVFGSHRKPEAIILPYAEFEALMRQRQRISANARPGCAAACPHAV